MKTFIIILTAITIFFACLAIGFQIGNRVIPQEKTPPAPDASIRENKQENIFLIHIKSLKPSRPALVSVWVMFVYYSETPSLTFLPVYSDDGSGSLKESIQELFAVSPDGSVSPEFIKILSSNLKMKADGYVLIDDQALQTAARRFPAGSPTLSPYQTENRPEREIIGNLCEDLKSAGAGGKKFELPWSEMAPDHARTDLDAARFNANWSRLTRAQNPPHCEIISPS